MPKTKPKIEDWEKEFRKMLKVFYTARFCDKMNFKPIESFIRQLLKSEKEKTAKEMQKIVQRYFKKVIKLPCPEFRYNLKGELKEKLKEEIKKELKVGDN